MTEDLIFKGFNRNAKKDEDKSLIKGAEKDLKEIDNLMDLLGKSNKQESENE